MKKTKSTLLLTAFMIFGAGGTWLAYFKEPARASNGSPEYAQPAAMPVNVTIVEPQKISLWKQFSGHVVAVDQAEIRPQVSGRITEILFEDGQYVEKGKILFVIDPRPYQAALEQAQAEFASAKTQADLAEKEYKRAKSLIATDAISQSTLDQRTNNRALSAANVKAATAKLTRAQLDLDYAHVKAPISGKVSRAEITVGNLVQTGPSAPVLTSIVSNGDVYVDFEIDESTYLALAGYAQGAPSENISVRIKLGQDQAHVHGKLHSFDNKIDEATGTIRARAIFSNANNILLPGMSLSVEISEPTTSDTILISERAIGTDQDRKFVFTVNSENIAEYREVKIGASIDGQRIILSGLAQGDTVITKGLAHIRPDMPVAPDISSNEVAANIEPSSQENTSEEALVESNNEAQPE